ncbi:hypothetical protein HanRHA438_Chr04g0195381 [Helianthus annuus]|nr:hypothetical protein HanRHA438_Chr04g0195381 [Helianthus annuus]
MDDKLITPRPLKIERRVNVFGTVRRDFCVHPLCLTPTNNHLRLPSFLWFELDIPRILWCKSNQ